MNDNDKWRVGLTLMFWVVGIGITLIFLGNVTAGLLDDWLIVIPFIFTLISTVILWDDDTEKTLPDSSPSEKKSDTTAYTMALLMEMMDEDERQTFKERLQERILSGEVVRDESLIADMEKHKRG
ncbi:MAG: hypothetical protein MUE54_02155 [Anaerolineae bacterium]|nr:hypothetical protein [Anaerolineae bacterium]